MVNQQNKNPERTNMQIRDFGPEPLIININKAAFGNENYRTALWTGRLLQATLMSIPPRGDIGLEMHPGTDQFIKIEAGNAAAYMGKSPDKLTVKSRMGEGSAVFVPAGTWHNIVNIG